MGPYMMDLKSESESQQKEGHSSDSGAPDVPLLQENNAWELQPFLGCAMWKTKKDSVSVLKLVC